MGKTIGVVLALKDKCSPQLKKIAESMGVTEKEARKLQKQAKDLSKTLGEGFKKAGTIFTATIGAVTAVSTSFAIKAGETCDRIDDLSNKIGISRQGFQEWDYLLAQNGATIESLQMGFKKLTSNIVGASTGNKSAIKIFKQLGISIKDSTGHLKNQEQVFNEAVLALQRMPEGARKAQIANTLFGKSGSELMPLLNSTNKRLAEQRAEYKRLGLAISDDVIDEGNKLGDNIEKWKSLTTAWGAVIGGKFIPILNQLSDQFMANMPQIQAAIIPVVDGVIEAIKFLGQHIDALISIASGLITTFVSFQVISGTIKMITTLQKAIQLVTAAQSLWNVVMLMNPIGAIAVAIGALVAGVVFAYQKFEGFRSCVQAVWSVMQLLGSVIALVGKTIWDKIGPAVKFGVTLMSWITPIGLVIRGLISVCKWIGKVVQLVGGLRGIGDKVKKWADENRAEVDKKREEKPKKNALGTSFSSGGPTLVGENGPEIKNLNKGDTITPAVETKKILQNNSKKIEVHFHIAGNLIGNMEFIQQIKNMLALELKTALATV